MVSPSIEIYTTKVCPYCDKAKLLLTQLGLAFSEVNLTLHPEHYETLKKRNPVARTVPQIFINDTPIGGCDDLYALHAKGQLLPLLQSA